MAKRETEGSEPLKLTSLEVENVLRLKAVSLKMGPEGSLIIEGRNEQGKSSVLRSLEILLAGMSETPPEPIHGDERKGKIVAAFGDLVVSKTFTRGKRPALKVTTAEGMRAQAPQTMLDKLLDRVALDPLKFMSADDAEKLRTLSDLMGFDETDFEKRRQVTYDKRRDANREAKRLQIERDAVDVDGSAPDEEVSVSLLMERLKERRAHNAEIDAASRELDERREELAAFGEEEEALGQEIEALKLDIEKLEAKRSEARSSFRGKAKEIEEAETAFKKMARLPVRDVETQIERADETNARVRAKREAAELDEKLSEATRLADTLDNDLKQIDEERAAARMKARERLPVPELDITEDGVLYRGKPLSQAGSSAQLRVSVAVAMALNEDKRVKLLLLDDAEKLDEENTRTVLQMAREAGFQVLMARVGDGREASVLIEDGEVKAES